MTQPPQTSNLSLWALLFGNFIIGTGIMLPAGLLNNLMAEFAVSPAKAGQLLLLGGLVVGIGAPLFAAFTHRIDRRLLLVFALLLYAAGHLASALAPSFELQLIIRAITVIGAAIFTPQAAATAGLIVPQEKRAAAIAFIFIGWSAAAVGGIPLGGLLANIMDWRIVYGVMAVLALLAAAGVWLTLPAGLFATPLTLSSWKQALGSPVLLVVFLVTLLSMSGQFSMFGYIAPILKNGFAATPNMIALTFAVVGAAGIVGNTLASHWVARLGVDRAIALGLISLCIGFLGFWLVFGSFVLALVAGMFWGLGSFSSNSLQQSRLVQLVPPLAAATVALNTSVVYLGQAIGAAVGGVMVDSGNMAFSPLVAFGFLALALVLSHLAQRLKSNLGPSSTTTPKP